MTSINFVGYTKLTTPGFLDLTITSWKTSPGEPTVGDVEFFK
jgi:hypothetical protein